MRRACCGSQSTACAVVEHLHDHLSFVHLPMMEAAQGDEVRQFGLAALRPVLDRVAIDVTGEAAALVS